MGNIVVKGTRDLSMVKKCMLGDKILQTCFIKDCYGFGLNLYLYGLWICALWQSFKAHLQGHFASLSYSFVQYSYYQATFLMSDTGLELLLMFNKMSDEMINGVQKPFEQVSRILNLSSTCESNVFSEMFKGYELLTSKHQCVNHTETEQIFVISQIFNQIFIKRPNFS